MISHTGKLNKKDIMNFSASQNGSVAMSGVIFQVVVGHTTLKRYPRSIKADGQADGQQSENLMMRELAGTPG